MTIASTTLYPCPRCNGQMHYDSPYAGSPASWVCVQCGHELYEDSNSPILSSSDPAFTYYSTRPVRSDFTNPADYQSALQIYNSHNPNGASYPLKYTQPSPGFEKGNTLGHPARGVPKRDTPKTHAEPKKLGRPRSGDRDRQRMRQGGEKLGKEANKRKDS